MRLPSQLAEHGMLTDEPVLSARRSQKPTLPNVSAHKNRPSPDEGTLIGRFVRFRKAKDWTQQEAAERMGMSVNSLRAYERGSRTPNGPATVKILTFMGILK